MPVVDVPRARIERWIANFAQRHGGVALEVAEGALLGSAPDGSSFTSLLPFSRAYDGPAEPASFVLAAVAPERWGMLLVRKGGFAIARLAGDDLVQHKIGQRHVQGRTKAGGQSQQRFARRRDNQARQAYEAAADHAARLLGEEPLPVLTGGDHRAVDEVLTDPRLSRLSVVGRWLDVPDPRRAVLDSALGSATSIRTTVENAAETSPMRRS